MSLGTQIGNYRLSRVLGGGSMGAVYEAVHNQISRRVAVKVLHAHLSADPEQRSRFLNEARAVSRVQHPGLIQIYDCGELPGGQIYIVMEFLEGMPLADRLQTAEALPQGESLRIAQGIAMALAAAHQAGIIHRDLKPENIMLLGPPAPGTTTAERVRVLDFGIAKILQSQVDARQTAPGSVLGTPLYMSPEQCVGNLVTDPRADVYALGVMLYELLCGRPPFVSDRFAFLMRMHVNEAAKPLRERNPAIVAAAEGLVARMLAKRPADRPTMAQVAAELEQILLRHFGPTLENDRELSGQVRSRLGEPGGGSQILALPSQPVVSASQSHAQRPAKQGDGTGAAQRSISTATVVNPAPPAQALRPLPGAPLAFDREARSAAVNDTSSAGGVNPFTPRPPADLMATVVNRPATSASGAAPGAAEPGPPGSFGGDLRATIAYSGSNHPQTPQHAGTRPLLIVVVALAAATLGALLVALLMRGFLR